MIEAEIQSLGGYAIWLMFFFGFIIGNFSGLSFGIKSRSEIKADAKYENDLRNECIDLNIKIKETGLNEKQHRGKYKKCEQCNKQFELKINFELKCFCSEDCRKEFYNLKGMI